MRTIIAFASLIYLMAAGVLAAQDAANARGPQYISVIGTVEKVDIVGKVFGVKTAQGDSTTVKFDDKTTIQRVPGAEKINSGDVQVGDRILARVRADDPAGPAMMLAVEFAQARKSLSPTAALAWNVPADNAKARHFTVAGRAVDTHTIKCDTAGELSITVQNNGPNRLILVLSIGNTQIPLSTSESQTIHLSVNEPKSISPFEINNSGFSTGTNYTIVLEWSAKP